MFDSILYSIASLIGIVFLYYFQAKFKPNIWIARKYTRDHLKIISKEQKRNLLQPYTIEITDSYLLFEDRFIRSEIKWSNYKNVKKTSDYIFIYNNMDSITIVPKRSFENDNEFDQYYQILTEKITT
jgi:hypothetical protein